MNGYVWKAQPKWMKIIQAILIFPAIAIVAYTLIFDPDDTHHHINYAVVIFIVVGLMQLGFFLRALSRGDL